MKNIVTKYQINEWFHDPDKVSQYNYTVIDGVKYKLVPVEES